MTQIMFVLVAFQSTHIPSIIVYLILPPTQLVFLGPTDVPFAEAVGRHGMLEGPWLVATVPTVEPWWQVRMVGEMVVGTRKAKLRYLSVDAQAQRLQPFVDHGDPLRSHRRPSNLIGTIGTPYLAENLETTLPYP